MNDVSIFDEYDREQKLFISIYEKVKSRINENILVFDYESMLFPPPVPFFFEHSTSKKEMLKKIRKMMKDKVDLRCTEYKCRPAYMDIFYNYEHIQEVYWDLRELFATTETMIKKNMCVYLTSPNKMIRDKARKIYNEQI